MNTELGIVLFASVVASGIGLFILLARLIPRELSHRIRMQMAGDDALYVSCSCGWKAFGYGETRVNTCGVKLIQHLGSIPLEPVEAAEVEGKGLGE